MRRRGVLLLAVASALLLCAALPASASSFKPDAPFLAKMRAELVSGRPAVGADVWVYPEPVTDRRKEILHAAWVTTTDARGRFVLRAAFRSHVARAGAIDNWVNFMVIVATPRRFGVSGFPAHWAHGRWLIDPETQPFPVVLAGHVTPRHHRH